MAKDYNNLNNYQSLEVNTNNLYSPNKEFFLSHEFNQDINGIERSLSVDDDDDNDENKNELSKNSNIIGTIEATTGAAVGGATVGGVVGGSVAAGVGSISGAVIGGGLGAIGAAAVATVVVATVVVGGDATTQFSMPKFSVTNVVLNYFDIAFTYDASNVIDDTTSIMTFSEKASGTSLYTETIKLNNDSGADNSHTFSMNKLDDGKEYLLSIKSSNGVSEATENFEFTTPKLVEPESIYGEVSLGDYSVDYDKSVLNYSIKIEDTNSYLTDIKIILEAYDGTTATSAADGNAISLDGFTKGYFISLKFTATSSHPRDVRDETQNKEFVGGVIYY